MLMTIKVIDTGLLLKKPKMTEAELTPDHVPCRHCHKPISWDEVTWVHDLTGFADCHLQVTDGVKVGTIAVINPTFTVTEVMQGAITYAVPENEDWA
jgi:hypothetical protein